MLGKPHYLEVSLEVLTFSWITSIDIDNHPIPTVGFQPVLVKYKTNQITFYDLGGGSRFRGIWHNYFAAVGFFRFIS